MKIDITGIDEIRDIIESLPERVLQQAKTALRTAAAAAARTVKQNAREILKVRTGNLLRSINWEASGNSIADLKASVFSGYVGSGKDVVYAKTHEFGALIRAKNKYTGVPGGPYLNIPLPSNQTQSGVMRSSAYEIFNSGGFIFKSKKGNWLVAAKGGTPMFALKKEVTIPPRLGMIRAVEDDAIPTLLSMLKEII